MWCIEPELSISRITFGDSAQSESVQLHFGTVCGSKIFVDAPIARSIELSQTVELKQFVAENHRHFEDGPEADAAGRDANYCCWSVCDGTKNDSAPLAKLHSF